MDAQPLSPDASPPDRPGAPKLLRLLAHDGEDLQVISAALQDAIAHVGDIRYEAEARRLTVLFNRFRWEAGDDGPGERVYAALQFGDVLRVRHRALDRGDRGALVNCMAVDFDPGDPPGGAVLLRFSHGGDLCVEVECIDAVLADVSDPWTAVRAPDHGEEDEGGEAGAAAPTPVEETGAGGGI